MLKKIIVEVPISWIENPSDGHTHHKFISNFLIALASRSIPIYLMKVPFGADRALRSPEKGVLVFSYHSFGQEKNVWHMKESPVTPLFCIDKAGYSGWADIVDIARYQDKIASIPLAEAQDIISRYRDFFHQQGLSKYPQAKAGHLSLPKRYVFFPLQVQNDPVSELSPLHALEMLKTAAQYAANYETHLLVKRHPFCQSLAVEKTLADIIAHNPWVKQVDANIHTLINQAHSVITVNSGVGIEALLDGAAVYCSGASEWYAAANPLHSLEDIAGAFAAQPIKMNAWQQQLVAFLVSSYWLDPDDLTALDNRINACIAEFDPEAGIDGEAATSSQVLLPIILDLQGRLEYEMRRAKLATLDLDVVVKENRLQAETFNDIRRISQENMQLSDRVLELMEETNRLRAENVQVLEENRRLESALRQQRESADHPPTAGESVASSDQPADQLSRGARTLVDRMLGRK